MPCQLFQSYSAFLANVDRRFRVHGDLSDPVKSTVGVPEGCALAVYCMLQLNWLLVVDVQKCQAIQNSVCFINYVDNWLFSSFCNRVLHDVLQRVHVVSGQCNFRISSSKTWMSSTHAQVRKHMKGWYFQGCKPAVCDRKVELGMLMKFTKRLSVKEVSARWDEGVTRMNRLLLSSWSSARKLQVVRRGIFPQIFASCETVHISLSNFRRLRVKLNTVVHGPKTHSSHYLSPLFTSQDDYEPFLYVFKARLASLKAMAMSFDPRLNETWMKYWDVDLNASPTKILGPVGCFLWSCQILGWKVQGPLQVATTSGLVLHLYHTPFKVWKKLAEQAWVDWVVGKAKVGADLQIQHISWDSYKSLWSQRKMKDFPLALKFRTLGILSSSALAQIRNQDQGTCEFCQAQEAGHYHLIFRCPHTRPLRDLPRFLPLQHAPTFTRCTGIPSMSLPLDRTSRPPTHWTFTANTDLYYIFTDGSASPPALPHIRCSSWAVSCSSTFGGDFVPWAAGITPGHFHDISRAETYAILACLETIGKCHIYCDNQGVVQVLSDILETGFDVFRYRSHPNFDLWVRVHHLLITRPPGSVKVEKVKSHQDNIHLLGHAAQWKARGNDAVDALAKRTLEEFNTSRLAQRPEWQTAHENRRLDQAYLATQFLHELSLLLFKTRNSENVDDQERLVPEAELLGNPPADSFQLFPVGIPVSFPGKKWDGRWLTLVCHYFAQLQWTSSPAPLAGEISCLEVLVDLLISYQVHTPLNKKNLKRKHGHISHLDWEHITVVNYLLSPGEAALLPPPSHRVSRNLAQHNRLSETIGEPSPCGTHHPPIPCTFGVFEHVANMAISPCPPGRQFCIPLSRIHQKSRG